MQQKQILRGFQEKISSTEDYISSCVWNRRESFVEKASAVGQRSAGPKSGCVTMCCQKCNGLPKKPHHLPYLVTKPASGKSACIWEGKYFPFIFLMSENVNIHFSGRKTRVLSGRMLCSTEGACCEPTAACSIFRWLLQGKKGKTRQGMFPSYQHMMSTDPMHVKTLPDPSKNTLIAFIHTLSLCEKS